jgi:hypothetical protein
MKLKEHAKRVSQAVAKAGMWERRGGKFVCFGRFRGQWKQDRAWRIRAASCQAMWEQIRFAWLQRRHPGHSRDGQRLAGLRGFLGADLFLEPVFRRNTMKLSGLGEAESEIMSRVLI